jgi:hypothetical protein
MEIATLGRSSWMPCAPQGVKGLDDDEDEDYDDDDDDDDVEFHRLFFPRSLRIKLYQIVMIYNVS